ncbi:HET-domain-containing protein, partial [Polyplosphaeria fusca]
MKLINTSTHRIEDLGGSQPPEPYAILSHTWCADHEEVTYQEMLLEDHMNLRNRPGYRKIEEACRRAREAPYHLKYAWIDTVCIDKTSSAELSEAINSMFRYYREAAVCFALLSGWTHDSGLAAFQKCKWFQRGWCLQELIAPLPRSLEFFDEAWVRLGTKHDLAEDIERATKINTGVLTGQIMLDKVPVAVRMSWASSRQTRRVEDRAYSLLGIMGINMSMLYGEGSDAFLRLQAEIIRQSTDMSIFAWTTSGTQKYMGLLAPCPEVFEHSQALVSQPHALLPAQEYSITNRGIKFEMTL